MPEWEKTLNLVILIYSVFGLTYWFNHIKSDTERARKAVERLVKILEEDRREVI